MASPISHDHTNAGDHLESGSHEAVARTQVGRRVWSPAQIISGLLGLFLVVMGAVVLLRTGLDSLTGDTASVLNIEHTALMGGVDLVVGLLFLLGAGTALGSRSGLMSLGLLSLAFGLIVAIEPDAMAQATGGDESIGWLYAGVGVISLIAALASPTVNNVRRTSTRSTADLDEI